ncbi:MAG: outer-membrane lipoprotein carrier protein LolA [Xanthobacteraceae bacterium]
MASRRATVILAAAICGFLATAPALAESVPLPVPAPQPKSGDAPTPPLSVPAPPGDTAPAAPSSSHSFFPFTLPFGGSAEQATAFTPQQRGLLDRVSKYLTSMQTLVGNFVQIAPDGSRTDGTFYIQKPGKVRFEYNPPSPTEVIADGSSVAVRNRDLLTQDLWPLSQTPLRYLLADHINLIHDTDVVSVSSDDKFITVVIEEKQVMVGTSRLMVMFDAKSLALKQWTVTDPQGLDTTVSVYNLDTAKKPDPNLFVINYTRNPSISNQ